MITPQIELIPLRQAVGSDRSTTLDLLIKIIPPEPDLSQERPPLNLSLVIDRSGSMKGQKIQYARQAACYAIEQLLSSDRISVIIYDDRVETLIPSQLATNKTSIIAQIQRVQPRNMTALHRGWVEGGIQVSQYLNSEQLNRVILLSDGLANQGETNPDVIAADVKGLTQRGVSTTTMGMGGDYNEDLLEAMATAGDGNYYYIESPEQLPHIFETELQGLMATMGRDVTLRINPQADVELVDIFNDFPLTRQGEYQLPNLIQGNPFLVGIRLKVPAIAQETELCRFRLSWNSPENSERQKQEISLRLPAVSSAELEQYPFDSEVREQITLMISARAKLEATQRVDRGDYEGAKQVLKSSKNQLEGMELRSTRIQQESLSLDELETDLQQQRFTAYRKRGRYEYQRGLRSSHQSGHDDYYTRRYMKRIYNRIHVIQGNIVEQQVDAIFNPTEQYFDGGITDAVIHAAAGSQLRQAYNQLAPGEQITEGFNLPAQWIIHAVDPHTKIDIRGIGAISALYNKSLEIAVQHSIATIAFPIVGNSTTETPLDREIREAFEAVVAYLNHAPSIEKVIFVCCHPGGYKYCLNYFQSLING